MRKTTENEGCEHLLGPDRLSAKEEAVKRASEALARASGRGPRTRTDTRRDPAAEDRPERKRSAPSPAVVGISRGAVFLFFFFWSLKVTF